MTVEVAGLNARQEMLVARARAGGVTWADIAAVLGVLSRSSMSSASAINLG